MTNAQTKLSWRAVGLIGLTGVVMGLATSLIGVPPTMLALSWVAFYVVWVATVVLRSIPRPFVTIVLGSVLSGVFTGGIQSVLRARFRAQNPWWAEEIAGLADAELVGDLLLHGVSAGLMFGLIVGAVAWGIARFRSRSMVAA